MNSPQRTPDWLLERIALGELPPGQVVRKEARPSSRRLAPAWGLLVPALATVALFVLARPDDRVGETGQGQGLTASGGPVETTRSKGLAPQLVVHRLPRAYALDDAPRFERFFFITGDAPFSVAPVLEAARTLAEGAEARSGELSLPEGLTQVSFTLEKQR